MTHTFATHIFDNNIPRPAERFSPGDLHHFRGNHYAISSSSLFHPHPSRPKCTANHTLAVPDHRGVSQYEGPPSHKCHWNGSFRLKGAILMWRPKKRHDDPSKKKHIDLCESVWCNPQSSHWLVWEQVGNTVTLRWAMLFHLGFRSFPFNTSDFSRCCWNFAPQAAGVSIYPS